MSQLNGPSVSVLHNSFNWNQTFPPNWTIKRILFLLGTSINQYCVCSSLQFTIHNVACSWKVCEFIFQSLYFVAAADILIAKMRLHLLMRRSVNGVKVLWICACNRENCESALDTQKQLKRKLYTGVENVMTRNTSHIYSAIWKPDPIWIENSIKPNFHAVDEQFSKVQL